MTTRTPRWLVLTAIALVAVLTASLAGSASAHGKHSKSWQGKTLEVVGDKTKLNTDPATTKVLLDNGIVPQPVGPTGFELRERDGGPSVRYTFPITGGMLNSKTLAGTIDHSGGIEFVNTNNGKSLLLTNFQIVIDDNPGLTAMVGGDPNVRVRILDLDLTRAKVIWSKWNRHGWKRYDSKRMGKLVRIKNVDASLTDVAAGALNASLGVDFFAEGIELGTAQVFARVTRH